MWLNIKIVDLLVFIKTPQCKKMGCCESKRTDPEPVHEHVTNALQDKSVLLVDLPSKQTASPHSNPEKLVVQPSPQPSPEYRNVKQDNADSSSPTVSASNSTDPLVLEGQVVPGTKDEPETPGVQGENISIEAKAEEIIAEISSLPITSQSKSDSCEPVVEAEAESANIAAGINSEPAVEAIGDNVVESTSASEDAPSAEEPAVKYAEVDRIASFNLGHSHESGPNARDSEHDHDRLKHFQKLGSATLVQGRHGPLMTGRGGKNRRSSTVHIPTEAPVSVSPRSAEI